MASGVCEALAGAIAPAEHASEGSAQLPPSIYLDGCAWGCGFYAGVQGTFERAWGTDFGTRTVMQGDSAGALIAMCWALGMPTSFTRSIYLRLAQCGTLAMLRLELSEYHDRAIDVMLEEHPDAHTKLRGRFQIGVTRFPRQHEWISEWASNDDLRSALHASMHIPIYCREVPRLDSHPSLRDRMLIDGAISMGSKHLAHGSNTLVISAAPWTALPDEKLFDIAVALPSTHCLFPPSEGDASQMFALGEGAAEAWLVGGHELGGKRRSPWFKYGGAVLTVGMWGGRMLEGVLPRRVRSRL